MSTISMYDDALSRYSDVSSRRSSIPALDMSGPRVTPDLEFEYSGSGVQRISGTLLGGGHAGTPGGSVPAAARRPGASLMALTQSNVPPAPGTASSVSSSVGETGDATETGSSAQSLPTMTPGDLRRGSLEQTPALL
jgi:hypothetical protein